MISLLKKYVTGGVSADETFIHSHKMYPGFSYDDRYMIIRHSLYRFSVRDFAHKDFGPEWEGRYAYLSGL